MKGNRTQYDTFKKGSKTYFNSSLFFPASVRRDVFALYGFVRVADDFVDSVPADTEGFRRFRDLYTRALNGVPSGDTIIDSFVELLLRKHFHPGWVEAFLDSMEQDLHKKVYTTLDETLAYIYGSAEVIGLFMAKIMDLAEQAYEYARLLGRAMQYINFIRDIDEDLSLGRTYLPIARSDLESLEYRYTAAHPSEFRRFMDSQLSLYDRWQEQAEKGFAYIPGRYLIPVKTASDMYGWTASKIRKNPFIVYEKKVKPGKSRIILQVLMNTLFHRTK